MKFDQRLSFWIVSIVALVFGLLTIHSGGSVLFLDGVAREDAGNYVPFVLWFNFVAGFLYLLTSAGLFLQKPWAVWASITLAISTLIVFALLGIHILNGGDFENRTVAAMSLRSIVWGSIAIFAYRKISRH